MNKKRGRRMRLISPFWALFFVFSAYASERTIDGWSISGTLNWDEKNINLHDGQPSGEFRWVLAIKKEENWYAVNHKTTLSLEENKNFIFTSDKDSKFKAYSGTYRFAFYYRGRLSDVTEVELTRSGQKIEGLMVNFQPPGDRILAMKIVNIVTGIIMPTVDASIGFDETGFSDPIYGNFRSVFHAESNKDGELKIQGLPKGDFRLGLDGSCALSYGVAVRKADRMPSITKEEYERQKAADELPILYVLPKGSRKGMLWKRMKVTYQKIPGQKFNFIPPGATLEFTGPYKEPDKKEPVQKQFRIDLDEYGWLKTPLLDRGWYNIKLISDTGNEYEDIMFIDGIMTCSHFELPDEPPGEKKTETPKKEDVKNKAVLPNENPKPSTVP
jgi:hypothetical protein